MAKKKSKQELLAKVPPKEYEIFGIFDFDQNVLIYVHLDLEQVELEFDLSSYDESRYDIVKFSVQIM